MSYTSKVFSSKCRDLGDGNYLHFIDIPVLTDEIIAHIDGSIVAICEGTSGTDLPTIKARLTAFLKKKEKGHLVMGAIAEFFGHLYLTEMGFKQEFLFLNLEEGSIKKGFDGYYSHNGETWIYESKSGSSESKDVSHVSKIGEAYADLKDKISGNPANNPWRNAYNHASHGDLDTDEDVRKNLKTLSDLFTNGSRFDMASFNFVPGSTLFIAGSWASIDADDLAPKLQKLMDRFSFTKIQIICVNKASLDLFRRYLES